MKIDVVSILPADAEPWILHRHYARRMCPISYAFGAYRGAELVGVVTYGLPASPNLCVGLAGEIHRDKVIELNRLCCDNSRNIASQLVGRSLQMLPRPLIVVSFADTGQGHVGYIYQATNFLYTGLTDEGRKTPRADRIKVGGKHGRHQGRLHGEVDTSIELVYRHQKHRYVFLCGDKRQKALLRQDMLYAPRPYPKGETKRYDASADILTQQRLF